MQRSTMSPSDFNATYGGTWLLVKYGGNNLYHPCFIRDVISDGGTVIVCRDAVTDRVVQIQVYADSTSISWDHPNLGYINHGKVAILHQRVMSRQWKRGLRSSQVHSEVFGRHMASAARVSLNYEFNNNSHIKQLFKPDYLPFEEAVERIMSGRSFARAFSADFTIEAHPNYKLPVLRYKNFFAGFIKSGDVVLSESCQHLEHKLSKAR